jgi:hypothetical protein
MMQSGLGYGPSASLFTMVVIICAVVVMAIAGLYVRGKAQADSPGAAQSSASSAMVLQSSNR